MICVVFITHLYHEVLEIDFVWFDMANNLQLQSSWRWSLTYNRKMAVLGMTGDHGVNTWKFLDHVILSEGQDCFAFCETYLKWKKSEVLHIIMLGAEYRYPIAQVDGA